MLIFIKIGFLGLKKIAKTLDSVAKYFDLGDFNHHRASDDARMLAMIFDKMAKKLTGEGITKISELSGVKFLYRDFRIGFREGQKKARELGMYMQKYCGCIFSEEERYQKQIEKDLTAAGESGILEI